MWKSTSFYSIGALFWLVDCLVMIALSKHIATLFLKFLCSCSALLKIVIELSTSSSLNRGLDDDISLLNLIASRIYLQRYLYLLNNFNSSPIYQFLILWFFIKYCASWMSFDSYNRFFLCSLMLSISKWYSIIQHIRLLFPCFLLNR